MKMLALCAFSATFALAHSAPLRTVPRTVQQPASAGASTIVKPDVHWNDTDGNRIEAHAAGMLQAEDGRCARAAAVSTAAPSPGAHLGPTPGVLRAAVLVLADAGRWFWYGESKKTSSLADHGVNCYSAPTIAGCSPTPTQTHAHARAHVALARASRAQAACAAPCSGTSTGHSRVLRQQPAAAANESDRATAGKC